MIVRDARPDDAPALAEIYAHWVLTSHVTFEETAPEAAEMAARAAVIQGQGLPYLVAEDEAGVVQGFAYASAFRARPAYRYTAEDTVYLRPDQRGKGLGSRLVRQVIAGCDALGVRQMVAVIGDSANAGSIGLHRALGYRQIGLCEAFGFKLGRWVDVVLMQKTLGAGADLPPSTPGLPL